MALFRATYINSFTDHCEASCFYLILQFFGAFGASKIFAAPSAPVYFLTNSVRLAAHGNFMKSTPKYRGFALQAGRSSFSDDARLQH